MDELLWAGADAQARALREGSVTAPDLLEAVLARAAALAPALNAFRVLYPDSARAEAREAQRRLDAGERAPLLGVPVAVKDDTDVAGDVTTLGGRPQFPPAEVDSDIVAGLRAAGAVVVGHTLTPERCLWPFTETLTYGATRNPWDPSRTPAGSSGGSAAAVAAGIVGAATGSDGGGSIRMPAAATGVFGLKTTRGLVPLTPQREGWHGLGTAGPLSRTVADSALMLEAMTGGSYRSAVDTDPAPLRIALAWRCPVGRPPMDRHWKAAVSTAADRLRALGHTVTEADPGLGARPTPQFLVRYLRGAAEDVAALPHPEWLEPRTRRVAALGRLVPDRVLRWARDAEAGLHARLAPFLAEYDVILQPTWTRTPLPVGHLHGRGLTTTYLGIITRMPYFPTWNVLGLPVATVPVGFTPAGMPTAVQLVGPADSEARLLALAAQYERAHPWAGARPPAL
ncbi:amidase family protein [Actinokineospora sp. PR83]|uniref:amidase family protein n=1 Tax=Actinokineospora sp. PR83 TaxID=2884908 RepID=UPI001EEE5552|nr:amidase family protein [Actinokineospora sp. PR83]MCG8918209.1 amidase family protein [Actinokineospora sp. PR83]